MVVVENGECRLERQKRQVDEAKATKLEALSCSSSAARAHTPVALASAPGSSALARTRSLLGFAGAGQIALV